MKQIKSGESRSNKFYPVTDTFFTTGAGYLYFILLFNLKYLLVSKIEIKFYHSLLINQESLRLQFLFALLKISTNFLPLYLPSWHYLFYNCNRTIWMRRRWKRVNKVLIQNIEETMRSFITHFIPLLKLKITRFLSMSNWFLS